MSVKKQPTTAGTHALQSVNNTALGKKTFGNLKPLGLAVFSAFAISTATLSPVLLSTQAQAVSQTDFSDLVAKVAPTVVRVNVTQEVGTGNAAAYQQIPEVWRRFFELPKPQSRLKKGTGSGFFIGDGYLLTNHHVVAGADKITITLNDRRELDAELVGSDKRTDVAVLKVTSDHPSVSIGRSDSVRVGEPVLAIGSPFGFDYSASAGIVSATSRSISREDTVPFIQTDVALNPGNSGGPLFNKHGDVIGINSRIFSGTGGYMGLSFSIPIDLAMDIFQQIKDTGSVTRAYLGVYPQDIDRNLAEVYNLEKPTGALITQVEPNSGADRAGIKSGDIILRYNGEKVNRAADLINAIARARVNDDFSVTVQREKRKRTLYGKLGLAPDNTEAPSKGKNNNAENPQTRLGISIRALTEREKFSLGNVAGVLVGDLDPTGIAARARLKRGDVITQLNGKKTPSIRSFSKAARSLPKRGVVEVRIVRRGVPMILGMRVNK